MPSQCLEPFFLQLSSRGNYVCLRDHLANVEQVQSVISLYCFHQWPPGCLSLETRYPLENLGKKAAENLLQMIADPFFDANYEFEVDIVQRDSVRRL